MSEPKSGAGDSSIGYDHFWNPLGAKLDGETELRVGGVVCAWSDLLGFGTPFTQTRWQPDSDLWNQIAARLSQSYQIHCRHTPSLGEFMLTLNDGVVRTRVLSDESNECLSLSFWLRAVVWAHLDVNKAEFDRNLPGTRTVITAGHRAFYSFPEVRLDDLVVNYSRKEPGLSELAKRTGNPLLICNPEPLQMNTAFSKAYILDAAGSKAGLKGSSVYVDQSILDAVEALCSLASSRYRVIQKQNESDFLFAVEYLAPPPKRPWCFGMLLDREPGNVELDRLTSNVFRLKKFYPNDENPEEFCFDLEIKQ